MPTTAPESIPIRIHNNGSSPAFNKRAKMYADNPKVEAKDKSISPAVTKKNKRYNHKHNYWKHYKNRLM